MDINYIVGGTIIGFLCTQVHYLKPAGKVFHFILVLSHSIGYGVIGALLGKSVVQALMGCIFMTATMLLAMIDYQHMILPSSMIYFFSVLIIGLKMLEAYRVKEIKYFVQSLLGGIVGYMLLAFLFYACILIVKKEGLGYGDVRYCGLLGLFMSPEGICLTLFIASFIGALWGSLLFMRNNKSEYFPFGPSLSIGASIVMVWGEALLKMY